MDAAASGSKSKDWNSSSTLAPSSLSSTSRTSSAGTLRAPDCSSLSSVVSTSGRRSVRVEAIWPNFTNMPPQSSSISRRRRANSGVARLLEEAYRRPVRPRLRAYPMICHDRPSGENARRSDAIGCSSGM